MLKVPLNSNQPTNQPAAEIYLRSVDVSNRA